MEVGCLSPAELAALCQGEVTGDDRDRLLALAVGGTAYHVGQLRRANDRVSLRLERFDESQAAADATLSLAEHVDTAAPAVHQHTILLARALTARSERLIAAGDPDAARRSWNESWLSPSPGWGRKEQRSTDAAFFFDWARQRIASLQEGSTVPGG